MNNPNYRHTITLFHKERVDKKDVWTINVLKNCFYKEQIQVVQNNTEVSQQNTYTVRIPLDQVKPVGRDDIVVYGEVNEEVTKENPATSILLKYKPHAFRITAVSDNTIYPLGKHIRLGG